jgi:hypothetical protein
LPSALRRSSALRVAGARLLVLDFTDSARRSLLQERNGLAWR